MTSRAVSLVAVLGAFLALLAPLAGRSVAGTRIASSAARPAAADYEIWVIDQSDTRPEGGGTLYVYPSAGLTRDPARAVPEVVDLGGAAQAFCMESTGSVPRRPHMISFNHTQTHAIISYVASGHVLFLDAATRAPVACLDVGAEAHAALPAPDQSFVLVANQGGKRLERIRTDYGANTFTHETDATLDLAACHTASGAPCESPSIRPDNAPVCPVLDDAGRLAFVTLRGGGLFVVDPAAKPMAILAEYDRETVHPNGCGGSEAAGLMFIRAGGGTKANPTHADLYAFPLSHFSDRPHPPNTPAPVLVYSHDERHFVDAHGGALTKAGRYLWVGDRFANRLVVVDTGAAQVVDEIPLSGGASSDPAPDILDVSPDGAWVFVSLRGPKPLSMNAPGVDNAVGSTPGVAVLRVTEDGRRGEVVGVAPITHRVDEVEQADPHGLKVRWP